MGIGCKMTTYIAVSQGNGECCDYGIASSDSNKQWHVIEAENEDDFWDKLAVAEMWEDYVSGDADLNYLRDRFKHFLVFETAPLWQTFNGWLDSIEKKKSPAAIAAEKQRQHDEAEFHRLAAKLGKRV